jgi:hypothetical protein
MHKFVLATLAGAATLLAAASVHANDDGKARIATAESFATLDRNGDHRISRSEAGFDRLMSQTFAEVDTDGDGFVSPAEFTTAERTGVAVSKVSSR